MIATATKINNAIHFELKADIIFIVPNFLQNATVYYTLLQSLAFCPKNLGIFLPSVKLLVQQLLLVLQY